MEVCFDVARTTLLNYILDANHGKKIAIIENEFGEARRYALSLITMIFFIFLPRKWCHLDSSITLHYCILHCNRYHLVTKHFKGFDCIICSAGCTGHWIGYDWIRLQ